MKNHILSILLVVICAALAAGLLFTKKENIRLAKELAARQPGQEQTSPAKPSSESVPAIPEYASVAIETPVATTVVPLAENPSATNELEASGRRMMKSMAQMMENPTMNKMMEASQRGAIGALYADMIEYLGLDADETKYFMDLLMYRQMKNVDLSMKMMGGQLNESEKEAMLAEIKGAGETMKTEMEKFLNNPDDFAEFEFYEKTMGERMMLSSMDQKLGSSENALTDESYRELLGMMHDEKKSFDFSSDLHDQENADLSPERFSKENLTNHARDLDRLKEIYIAKAREMLAPEQLQVFLEAIQASVEMQKAQLDMAAQMFGGNK